MFGLAASTASNLVQVATCCVLRPTRPPTLSGLWGESQMWLIRAVVCLLAAPWVQFSISTENGWLHNVLWYH